MGHLNAFVRAVLSSWKTLPIIINMINASPPCHPTAEAITSSLVSDGWVTVNLQLSSLATSLTQEPRHPNLKLYLRIPLQQQLSPGL